MKIFPSTANGIITAPPSKSMAHRYLICAALSDGISEIHNIAFSEDIKATLQCIEQLGASAKIENNTVFVNGCGSKILSENFESERFFNCNESGSTLRFFIPLAMLSEKKAFFSGSKVLMTRPLSVYEEICKNQKIKLEHKEDELQLQGKLKSGNFEIPGDISSQFITGLLFALPFLNGDSRIILTNSIESKPYINMTLQVQNEFGIKTKWENENTLLILGNQTYKKQNATVEGDYSNAAFLDVFNFLGGNVQVQGLKNDSLQGDKIYQEYFEKLKNGFATLDISDCPDLGPILFVLASANFGGEFTGTKRLKIKESNRGEVMCKELEKFGVKSFQEENRIVIYKEKLFSPKEIILGHNDHRIVMSMVTLLSLVGGEIEGPNAVKKSFPDYFEKIKSLGIKFES